MNSILRIIGIQSDFERLFYANEYKTLAGDKKRIIVALILILFLTLLALGYAVGSMDNLQAKMENPFSNWVDLSIREERMAQEAKRIEEVYAQPERRAALKLNDTRGWVMFNLEIYHKDMDPIQPTDSLAFPAWGRTLDEDDPLINVILSEDNLLWKDKSLNWDKGEALANCEIILTEEMMIRLGHDPFDQTVGGVFIREDTSVIYLRVAGVIKELPKFCNFICSSKFYNIKTGKSIDGKQCYSTLTKRNDGTRGGSFSFLSAPTLDVAELKNLSKLYFSKVEPPNMRIANSYQVGKKEWGICEIDFMPSDKPKIDSIFSFVHYAHNQGQSLGNLIELECSSSICSYLNSNEYHYLAFNFIRLDDIRRFRDDLKENHNIEIDMSQVETKENFALVGNLTLVISLILLAFGVLSIILFVNSLLKSHLYQVRSNLGTFKAFGLSNKFLNNTYLKIILTFLLLAIFTALGLSIIVDRIEQFIMVEESKFNIFDLRVFIALLLLVIISLYISTNTIKKILGDTPGNLIYER